MAMSYCPFTMEYLSLGRRQSGVGAGVGVDVLRLESELESESLKFVDSAALGSIDKSV